MLPEPLLHLRAAIKRGCHPDIRDLSWLAQNLNYLEILETEIQTTVQQWLDENPSFLLSPATLTGADNNLTEECETC